MRGTLFFVSAGDTFPSSFSSSLTQCHRLHMIDGRQLEDSLSRSMLFHVFKFNSPNCNGFLGLNMSWSFESTDNQRYGYSFSL